MPWAKSDNRLFDKQMVKCDGCCEWFHRMCERIPEKPFNEKYVKWYCHKCLLLEKALGLLYCLLVNILETKVTPLSAFIQLLLQQ